LYDACRAATLALSAAVGTASAGGDADTVDGFHANASPVVNTLLALDESGNYPDSVIPSGIARDAEVVTAISTHAGDDDAHHAVFTSAQHSAIGNASPHHAAVTLGGGSAGELTLSGQELTLAAVLTPTEHTAIGDASPHHAAASAGDGIVLSGQQVSVDLVSAWSGLEFSSGNLRVDLDAAFTWTGVHIFQNSVTISGANELRLRDSALKIHSSADGQLDIDADVEIEITAPITTVSADLAVDTNTLFVDASEDSVYINASSPPTYRGALTVQPANASQKARVTSAHSSQSVNVEEWRAGSGTLWMRVSPAGDLESGSFTSGLVGWQISQAGNAEFNNIVARGEFHASVFVVEEKHATGGTMLVAQGATTLYEQVTSN